MIDRFAPPRPSRAAVFGLVIRLGKAAADVMKRDPFRSVDPDHKVRGWGYDNAAQFDGERYGQRYHGAAGLRCGIYYHQL